MKYIIEPVTAYQQNCTILVCEETGSAAIVDPGGDLDRLVTRLESLQLTPEKILLTHGHMDHCGGADALRSRFGIPIEGPHEEDRFWIDQLPAWCEMAGMQRVEAFEPDRWLQQDDHVGFGAQQLVVKHCPGHTPGHVIFFHETARIAQVGDVLFQGSIGRTDFPRGDHATLIKSIVEQLWPLGDDVTFIPGHGPTSTFGRERRYNPFVADARFG
jgi:glyoxylase-like metal-dependent hydrolase (beta-lactamase superfamily II)